MTNCEQLRERLDDWLDDELSSSERADVEAHLAGCTECRAEAEGLQRLLVTARGLAAERQPARDLWPDIEARLQDRPQHRPLLVAMAASLLLAGVFVAGMVANTLLQEPEFSQQIAAERIPVGSEKAAARRILPAAQVELVDGVSGGSPVGTEEILLRNLLIVNLAIRQVEQALEADPDNAEMRDLLVSLYEQENSLLRRAERLNALVASQATPTTRTGI